MAAGPWAITHFYEMYILLHVQSNKSYLQYKVFHPDKLVQKKTVRVILRLDWPCRSKPFVKLTSLIGTEIFHKHRPNMANFHFSFPWRPGSLTIIQHLSATQRKAEAQMSHRLVLWAPWPLHWAAQSVN